LGNVIDDRNLATNKVIGYGHGLHHFQLTSAKAAEVQIAFGFIKISTPAIGALTRGIDLRSAEGYLKQLGYIGK